jgi:hypothetical protein
MAIFIGLALADAWGGLAALDARVASAIKSVPRRSWRFRRWAWARKTRGGTGLNRPDRATFLALEKWFMSAENLFSPYKDSYLTREERELVLGWIAAPGPARARPDIAAEATPPLRWGGDRVVTLPHVGGDDQIPPPAPLRVGAVVTRRNSVRLSRLEKEALAFGRVLGIKIPKALVEKELASGWSQRKERVVSVDPLRLEPVEEEAATA